MKGENNMYATLLFGNTMVMLIVLFCAVGAIAVARRHLID
jgi:hypothetical protein